MEEKKSRHDNVPTIQLVHEKRFLLHFDAFAHSAAPLSPRSSRSAQLPSKIDNYST